MIRCNRRIVLHGLAGTVFSIWRSPAFAFARPPGETRPINVQDVIESVRFQGGEARLQRLPSGVRSTVEPIVRSPSGRRFASMLIYGDVSRDLVWCEIVVGELGEWDAAKHLRHVAKFSSAVLSDDNSRDPDVSDLTNPGKNPLRWLDERTIGMIWEDGSRVRQVFSVDVATGRVVQLTSHPTHVFAFDYHSDGYVAYAAREVPDDRRSIELRETGYVVENPDAYSLINGHIGRESLLAPRFNCAWFLKIGDAPAIRVDANGLGRDLFGTSQFSIARFSPDAESLLLTATPATIPASWNNISDESVAAAIRDFHANGSESAYARQIKQLFIVRVETGVSAPALAYPLSLNQVPDMAWNPDSRSFALGPSSVAWPGSQGQSAIRSALIVERSTLRMTTLALPAALQTTTASDAPKLSWIDAKTIQINDGRTVWQSNNSGNRWARREVNADPSTVSVSVEESATSPPKLVVSAPDRGRHVLLDPNARLGRSIELANVRDITWTDAANTPWSGRLYLPLGYRQGQRYPLVIQSYIQPEADQFSLTGVAGTFPGLGPGWSVFAAQALAAKNIAVLQTGLPTGFDPQDEAGSFVAGIEAVIAVISGQGLIDPQFVGLSGFSHSGWHVESALTRSEIIFRSAIASDNIDGSYVSGVLFPGQYRSMNGTDPQGAGLKAWLDRAPGFNVDRIRTPLRIQSESEQGSGLIQGWEIFSGLRELDAPVEYYVLPNVHRSSHTIQNPHQVMVNQTGVVDWHAFWLLDHEDDDARKAEQYRRWRQLRTKRDNLLKVPRPGLRNWTY